MNDMIRPADLIGKGVPYHDELPVTYSKARITKTGDGLSEALDLAPLHVPLGANVVILLTAKAVSHEYDKVRVGRGADAMELDEFIETTVFAATSAQFIDPDLVAAALHDHAERVKEERANRERAEREAHGEFALDFDDDDD